MTLRGGLALVTAAMILVACEGPMGPEGPQGPQQYIAQEVGDDYLANRNAQTELRKVKSEMAALKKRLKALQDRRTELEEQLR